MNICLFSLSSVSSLNIFGLLDICLTKQAIWMLTCPLRNYDVQFSVFSPNNELIEQITGKSINN